MQAYLYKVMYALDSVNAIKLMSIIELHQCLGHIVVSCAHKLVGSRAIIGVKLDISLQETECDVCIYMHATQKPVPKLKLSPLAQNIKDKVHTDV